MAAKPEETERGVERLIFFTDAVTAIAITLLILPLVDIVATQSGKHPTVSMFIYKNLSQLFAFALSFLIIARLWLANHRILKNAVRTTTALMWLDIAWVFTIVVLPLPTEITAVFPQSVETVVTYIFAALLSTLCLAAISLYLYLHPGLEREGKVIALEEVYGTSATVAAFVVALVLELIFPALSYYALFALLLNIPIDYIVKPRIRKRAGRVDRENSTKPPVRRPSGK